MKALIDALSRSGKKTELLTGPDGCRILVMPHGGRVLGLFVGKDDDNFLWTNPALGDATAAQAFFASEQWCNAGGDRTWLAPENGFFCPNYPSSSPYVQPRQLDPGRYACTRAGNRVRLKCDLALHSYRTREDMALSIVREVEPAANPFHQLPEARGPALPSFAGYTLRTSLEIRGRPKRTLVGLWNLLQMPHGGCMVVPIRFPVRPTKYFGSFSRQDLVAGRDAIRYAMRRPGEHKIGVAAIALTGRAGYLLRRGSEWSLVVRNFTVNPSGMYVDGLPNAGACPGDAFQACNVSNERLGHFSELEYHVPAIGAGAGSYRCEDVSQVWAFRGTRRAVVNVARRLLGVAIS
jgi:hypothetical protein